MEESALERRGERRLPLPERRRSKCLRICAIRRLAVWSGAARADWKTLDNSIRRARQIFFFDGDRPVTSRVASHSTRDSPRTDRTPRPRAAFGASFDDRSRGPVVDAVMALGSGKLRAATNRA